MHATKAMVRVEIKDEDRGEIDAVFSTLDVIDSDGDVTVKGAFTDGAPVAISAYGHQTSKGELPVGKGAIRETTTEAVMSGRFFMDTEKGHDTFVVVKEMAAEDGPGQQWSYGLADIVAEVGDFQGQRVRYIKGVTVPEVSPVLRGAGVGTRVLDVKSAKQANSAISESLRNLGRERWSDEDTWVWCVDYDLDDLWAIYEISADGDADRLVRIPITRDGDTIELAGDEAEVQRTVAYAPKSASHQFSEHVKSVRADLAKLHHRTSEVMALRAQKGKGLATASVDELEALIAETKQLETLLAGTPDNPTAGTDIAREALVAAYLADVARDL